MIRLLLGSLLAVSALALRPSPVHATDLDGDGTDDAVQARALCARLEGDPAASCRELAVAVIAGNLTAFLARVDAQAGTRLLGDSPLVRPSGQVRRREELRRIVQRAGGLRRFLGLAPTVHVTPLVLARDCRQCVREFVALEVRAPSRQTQFVLERVNGTWQLASLSMLVT